jgi:RES domain-containing protein
MRVFRIQKRKYGLDISGKGSNLVSGRWNVKGDLLILYTAENKSLALLEKIDSFTNTPGITFPKFTLLEIDVPDTLLIKLEASALPPGWNDKDRSASQVFGMSWLSKNESLAISVPSVISGDRNILINPQHPEYNKIKVLNSISDFRIDSRLIK